MEAIWKPGWTMDFAGFDAYREVVKQSSDAFLAALDPAVLDRDIEAFGEPRRGGWLFRIEAPNHILSHLGEISVLRGIKGAGRPADLGGPCGPCILLALEELQQRGGWNRGPLRAANPAHP